MIDKDHDLEQIIFEFDTLSKSAKEIEWQYLSKILREIDYTILQVSWNQKAPDEAYDIKVWCRDNLKGYYKSYDKTWAFELEQDAASFVLRWS